MGHFGSIRAKALPLAQGFHSPLLPLPLQCRRGWMRCKRMLRQEIRLPVCRVGVPLYKGNQISLRSNENNKKQLGRSSNKKKFGGSNGARLSKVSIIMTVVKVIN